MKTIKTLIHTLILLGLCIGLSSCEEPRVYGSIGVSSYGGYHGGARVGGSVSIGGRIY
jgi:hypothetical protein